MCLFINPFSYRRKAKSDITCYKVLVKYDDTMIAPYYNFKYELNTLYTSKLKRSNVFSVDEGFHSFKNISDAQEFRGTSVFKILVECIIPKGSYYYTGKQHKSWYDNKKGKGYASSNLIIKQVF